MMIRFKVILKEDWESAVRAGLTGISEDDRAEEVDRVVCPNGMSLERS